MIRVIMHGCNGKMGQVISGLVAADEELQMVAGIDPVDDGHNPYPVFADIKTCDVEADVLIDFSTAKVVDKLIDYCVEKNLPCVLCTTGLNEAQLQKVVDATKEVSKIEKLEEKQIEQYKYEEQKESELFIEEFVSNSTFREN